MRVKNNFIGILSAVVIGGCASAPNLPENISLTDPDRYGQQRIKEIEFTFPSLPAARENAAKCIAMNISNESVTVKDSAGFVTGLGNYYAANNSQSLGGGGVTQYADTSKGIIVADGRTKFSHGWGLVDIVDFKMLLDASGDSVKINFSNIMTAQQDTGYIANDGFKPVGAWAGAGPMRVHDALKELADNTVNCMQ